jgi:hypothetical protein
MLIASQCSEKRQFQRLNEQAAHFVMQLPETRSGDDCAAKIEARTIKQISRIEAVAAQLKTRREKLVEERRLHVSRSV